MFSKHYQDELQFLREMGREYSRTHPEAAPFLSGPGGDPDVERLLEGFAFLTARIREKLDDELPEVVHSLLEIFFPHYLRPLPAMSVVAFDPPMSEEAYQVPRGTELLSAPVKGVRCTFRTAFDVEVLPLSLKRIRMNPGPPTFLIMSFEVSPGASLDKFAPDRIRLHLAGETTVSRGLYLSLTRHLEKVTVKPAASWGETETIPLPNARCRPVGFGDHEFLLPYPPGSFSGFRLLQEYFAFPQKFMFIDLEGLEGLGRAGSGNTFDLILELSHTPQDLPAFTASDVLLHCTPVVNLFHHDGDPIRFDQKQTEYLIKPAGNDRDHYEVFSVDEVSGLSTVTGERRTFRSLFSGGGREEEEEAFFRTQVKPSSLGEGADIYLAIVDAAGVDATPDVETLSLELTCTNRNLPKQLGIGDIGPQDGSAAEIMGYRNILKPTTSIPPPIEGDLYWRLISHLALNYAGLANTANLRKLLWLYNFRARVDRQAERAFRLMTEGIKSIDGKPVTRLFQGTPVRGLEVSLELDEDGFSGEGEMALFGTVFDEFLSQYVSLNSFSRLVIRGAKYGGVYEWPPRVGKRIVI
ncbi:MAG: type VI secretion system baseplate subunit TssF [Planctomycetota bacterium]